MTKTGRSLISILGLGILFFCLIASAGIRASLDRTEVPLDESVSLKITMEGGGDSMDPKFDAPDFEIMNQFQNSQFSSVYRNGQFENKSETSITYILRPLKIGALRIRNIQNHGDRASDLTVQVIQESLYKKSVQGDAPSLSGDAKNFFVKADLSKSKVYKGEQIIVSYYLYRRTRANVRDVMQYPSFNGFIREDLEMPILSNRPDFEAVNLGGIPFERALLARYAIYPIKDGKLRIDGFSVRVDYVPKNTGSDDALEDPVFQFFNQVTPRTGTSKSDPITVEVLPLPEEGKSPVFTGGVGDFEVSAQVDPGQYRANAPLTVKVAVRGKGNTSLVEFPHFVWPKELKLYQSQGKTKNLGQGRQEKTFEVVVIPLSKGSLQIPSINFEFFNPETRSYQRKSTGPLPIEILEGDPNSAPPSAERGSQDDHPDAITPSGSPSSASYGSLRSKDKRLEGATGMLGEPLWRLVSWFGLLIFFGFIGLVFWDQAKKRSLIQLELLKKKQSTESKWKEIAQQIQNLSSASSDGSSYSAALEKVADELCKTLDECFGISSRALPHRELVRILTGAHGVSKEICSGISGFLEFSEMLRFSSGTTFSTPAELASKVQEWFDRIQKICLDLNRNPLEKQS